MPKHDAKQEWAQYVERELKGARPLLAAHGLTLEGEQVHIGGERYLMMRERDVGGGGRKLVLFGRDRAGRKVVLKVSSDPAGRREIEAERAARQTLRLVRFAYRTLYAPAEILFVREGGYTLFATDYVEQEQTFIAQPLKEQFSLALEALKAEEGVHATTYSHTRVIRRAFGMWGSKEYFASFAALKSRILEGLAGVEGAEETLRTAEVFLQTHADTIEQYCGFLTHADFVPHNLRIQGGNTYLLDFSSLHFGNKYEGWARFLNFMLLYNRPLEQALLQYVRENRTEEEYLSLRLMRVYKLAALLEYYVQALPHTAGDLRALTDARIRFWLSAMRHIEADTRMPEEDIERYKELRDRLRSEEEQKRQKELH